MCVRACVCMCTPRCAGWIQRTISLFPRCGLSGLNSSHQVWQQGTRTYSTVYLTGSQNGRGMGRAAVCLQRGQEHGWCHLISYFCKDCLNMLILSKDGFPRPNHLLVGPASQRLLHWPWLQHMSLWETHRLQDSFFTLKIKPAPSLPRGWARVPGIHLSFRLAQTFSSDPNKSRR